MCIPKSGSLTNLGSLARSTLAKISSRVRRWAWLSKWLPSTIPPGLPPPFCQHLNSMLPLKCMLTPIKKELPSPLLKQRLYRVLTLHNTYHLPICGFLLQYLSFQKCFLFPHCIRDCGGYTKTSPQAKRHKPSLLFTSLTILTFITR